MIRQASPNRWSCLVTSFAMALGTTVSQLLEMVGHDGSEIIWPDLPDPLCRRGHHPQEMIYAAYKLGYTVTPFQALPTAVGKLDVKPYKVQMHVPAEVRMPRVMLGNVGVLSGETMRGQPHAVAWDGGTMVDPGIGVTDFRVETFWLTLKIKS